MQAIDRARIARETYTAYQSGDREMLEKHLSPGFRFYSPADVGIDLETDWTRCWPNAETIAAFDFKRIIDHDDEVVVTYEAAKSDGRRFRNTEVLGFDGDKIVLAEVYFGWNLV